MGKLKIAVLVFFQLLTVKGWAVNNDSLFIENVKTFIYKQMGYHLSGSFFTEWKDDHQPYVYLYVSKPDSVALPADITSSYQFFKSYEDSAKLKAESYKLKGYHTFCYKTYANSATKLNKSFLSYSNETKVFIMFHELMHNYFSQNKMKVPYEYNEAICDIMGNYGAQLYFKIPGNGDSLSAAAQLKSNEKIYGLINYYINAINSNGRAADSLNSECNQQLQAVLQHAVAFQKQRFDYKVNNAYLLKNQYYSGKYFLIKDVFLKQKNIVAFMEIVKNMPEDEAACDKYFENLRYVFFK